MAFHLVQSVGVGRHVTSHAATVAGRMRPPRAVDKLGWLTRKTRDFARASQLEITDAFGDWALVARDQQLVGRWRQVADHAILIRVENDLMVLYVDVGGNHVGRLVLAAVSSDRLLIMKAGVMPWSKTVPRIAKPPSMP